MLAVNVFAVNWAVDETYGGYSMLVNLPVVEGDEVHVGIQQSDVAADAAAEREAYSNLTRVIVKEGALVFLCGNGRPTTNFRVNVSIRGF